MLLDAVTKIVGQTKQAQPRHRRGVGRESELVERFSVQAVPTLLVMRNGQILSRQSGAAPVHVLRRWVDEALGRSP